MKLLDSEVKLLDSENSENVINIPQMLRIGSLVGNERCLGRVTLFLSLTHKSTGEKRHGFITAGSIFDEKDELVFTYQKPSFIFIGKIIVRKCEGIYDFAIVLLSGLEGINDYCLTPFYNQEPIYSTMGSWKRHMDVNGWALGFHVFPLDRSKIAEPSYHLFDSMVPKECLEPVTQHGLIIYYLPDEKIKNELVMSTLQSGPYGSAYGINWERGALGSIISFSEPYEHIPTAMVVRFNEGRFIYRALYPIFSEEAKSFSPFWDWEQTI